MRIAITAAVCVAVVAFIVVAARSVSPGQAVIPDNSEVGAFAVLDDAASTAVEGAGVEAPEAPAAEERAADAAFVSEPAHTPTGMEVPEELIPEVHAEHEADVVLVSLAEGYTAEELTEAINASGCTVPQTITDADIASGFVELTVNGDYDVEHAMTQLDLLPETAGAQPNFIYHLLDDEGDKGADALREALPELTLTASPSMSANNLNDEYINKQWMLDSINAFEAWEIKKVEGTVTVAVVDNGFLTTHADLDDNILGTYNAVTGGTDVRPIYGGHGTHVSGIIAAEANNGKGVAGVSYNAKLLLIQVFDNDEANSKTIAAAYDYIMNNPWNPAVKVVNMSVGREDATPGVISNLDEEDQLLVSKVNQAYDAGILTVCSAGNAANGKGAYGNYPSDFLPNALGVIALTNNPTLARADYSNYNMLEQNTKDISAPGSGVFSTYYTNATSYASMNGTSMASPCVAGVAALVFAAVPGATPDQVAGILCSSAAKIGGSSLYDAGGFSLEYGYGEVDAQAALELATAGFFIRGESALLVDGQVQFTASGADGVAWSSSDTGVATIAADGTVTGIAPGTATITGTANGKSFSRSVTVYSVVFEADGGGAVKVGDKIPLTFSHEPTYGTWKFGNTDENVASLFAYDDTRLGVLGVSPGTATITATLESNPNIVASCDVTVTADIATASVAAIANQAYTGAAITPNPTIKFKGATLVKDVDYTLSYENNVKQGTATVTITGKGRFEGTKTATFAIVAASFADASISGVGNATYTGGAISPNPTVKMGGRTLVRNTDYTVSYKNNVNVGTATVTVTGMNNYAGAKSVTFKITAAPISNAAISGVPARGYYTGRVITPGITVKYGSRTLRNGSDYTVSYANNKNVGTATITITGRGNYAGTAKRTFRIVRAPSYAGASSMPVSSTAAWSLANCSLRLVSGSGIVSISGSTVTAHRAGTAKIGVYDAAGVQVATRTVNVYNLNNAVRSIRLASNTGYVLDVAGAARYDGANLWLYRWNGTNAQKFRFNLNSDGTYRMACLCSGKMIDVSGGSRNNFANIWQWVWNGTNAQRWRITVDTANRLTFINKGSGKVLDLNGNWVANCSNIHQYASNGTGAQKWVLM